MLTTKEGWRSLRGEEMNDTMPVSAPYTLWLPWLWAAVSTAAFIALWFWEVHRVLRDRRSTVDSAADQRAVFRRRAKAVPGDPEAAAVLQRSESILRQAVDLYNKALRTPWRFLPGIIMGFRFYQEE